MFESTEGKTMTRQNANEIIQGMTEEAKIFWLSAMVKYGYISQAEAGFIIYNNK